MNLIFGRAILIPHAEDMQVANLIENADDDRDSGNSLAGKLKSSAKPDGLYDMWDTNE